MFTPQLYLTANVVYEYIWEVEETSKETSTHTTHYTGSPGSYTGYAIVYNTALPSPSQIETVGIPYSIVAGQPSTQHVLATIATHMPTTHIRPSSQTSGLSTTGGLFVDDLPSSEMPRQGKLTNHEFHSHYGMFLVYFRIVLLCLFLGGYLLMRSKRSERSRDASLEEGRGKRKNAGQVFVGKKDSLVDGKS